MVPDKCHLVTLYECATYVCEAKKLWLQMLVYIFAETPNRLVIGHLESTISIYSQFVYKKYVHNKKRLSCIYTRGNEIER